MKQVKKLLVILPLVALFVLGSLPVAAISALATLQAGIDEAQALLDATVEAEQASDVEEGKMWATKDAITPLKQEITKAVKVNEEDKALDALKALNEKVETFKKARFKGVKKTEKPNENSSTSTEGRQLVIRYYADSDCKTPHQTEATRTYAIPHELLEDANHHLLEDNYANVTSVSAALSRFVDRQQQNSYRQNAASFNAAAQSLLRGTTSVEVSLYEPASNRVRVIAYNIHINRMAFDQVSEVALNPDYSSTVGIVEAFYNKATAIRRDYILVGYVRRNGDPVITNSIASLERINLNRLRDTMDSQRVDAEYAALVVPNFISVPVEHIFPEGTRDRLRERVNVPYATWVTLQNTWRLVDIPSLFRTRIQKINEEGYTFRSMEYFNGENPITGLVASWDWANYPMGGDENDQFVARIFYDRAVAGAQEVVPSEKKVDAATAPQAQAKAPVAQAPVTAANTTTTTAPANTLPVTGASDSIFLFLSSAALMAVGILFFKKH